MRGCRQPDRVGRGQVSMSYVVVIIIGVALAFDYINGFHDAANSIATVVSTRVLTPKQAVAWAAFFNFAAFIFFGTKVADDDRKVSSTRRHSTPPRSSPALSGRSPGTSSPGGPACRPPRRTRSIGGIAGAAVAKVGWSALVVSEYQKIAVFIVIVSGHGVLCRSPIMPGVSWLFHRYRKSTSSTAAFGGANWSPPPRSASDTAGTTRRRRWASSWPC